MTNSGSSNDVARNATAAAAKKMDPELKARWVAALRSGEYRQGKSALLNDYREMCCLGVFAHICGASDEALLNNADVLEANDLPQLDAIEPKAKDGALPIRNALAWMNDDGKSFSEIADWIEKTL